MSERKANICGLATIVIWFLTPLQLALVGKMPPFLIGAFSFLTAFALVLAWWVYKGEDLREKFDMPLPAYALGIYGIGIYNAIYIYALKTGPLLEVNLLNYLWPAFLIVFGSFLKKTRPDAPALGGIFLCFAGSYFVFESRGEISFSGSHAMLMLGVLCGVMWGSYSALLKYIRVGSDQIAVFFLLAGLLMLALHLVFEPTVWPSAPAGWIALVCYMLGRSAFPMWNYAMKHGQARLIGSLSYFIPFFSTLALAAAGFADFSSHNLFIGASLIIFGCLVINLKSLLESLPSLVRRMAV
ncbi:MAG: EamA family transporter [Proteobacteria bacterium]|nr:EamA family transporter [Pseudomonadota bacterium]